MSDPAPAPIPAADDVDSLRARIDVIDAELMRLFEQRAEVVRDLARRKGPGSPMRPSREAEIARRIAARPAGALPAGFLHGLWREIISGFSHMQSPVTIAVCAPPGGDAEAGPMALARDHFGLFGKLVRTDTAQRAISLVSAGDADAALLPPVWGGEDRPWWPEMLGAGAAGGPLRVIGALPLVERPVGRGFPDMMLVGAAPAAPSGVDRGLVAVQFAEPVSRDRQTALFTEAGLAPRARTHFRPGGAVRDLGDLAIVLFETDSFVEENDPRFADLSRGAGIDWVRRAGAYPAPLREDGR